MEIDRNKQAISHIPKKVSLVYIFLFNAFLGSAFVLNLFCLILTLLFHYTVTHHHLVSISRQLKYCATVHYLIAN